MHIAKGKYDSMRIVRFRSTNKKPYPLKIEVTAAYYPEINRALGLALEIPGYKPDFQAHLVYMRGDVVLVKAKAQTVGHLSRVDARRFRKRLLELGLCDVAVECFANLSHSSLDFKQPYEICLDLDIQQMSVETLQ